MLSVRNACLERYFQPVFKPVSFDLGPSGVVVLTGDNGSGKTTLIRMLAGLIRPSSGAIESSARSVAYVGHSLGIKDDLDVFENLEFSCRLAGGHVALPLVERIGLRHVATQLARTLSAGQRKRCALGRLLARPADLWLLDEPYSSLDQDGCRLVDEILQVHVSAGGACVMATHGSLRPSDVEYQVLNLEPGQEAA
ncbi:MAG: heme ABC exporter ATP-binding protein CcmA [Xanthomonadales bacterium]|nr:heme ABC exporter ATP-binding protein CcmA [Xanthomonadales bacterium]